MANEKPAVQPAKPDSAKQESLKRSPNFPGISLKEAVRKAKTVFDKDGTSTVPPSVLQGHWGYSAKSSSGMIAIGALRKFGLIEGSPNVKLTPLALAILNPQTEPTIKQQSLQRAALLPEPHKQLWDEYKGKLPSDAALEFKLRELQFTPAGARSFISQLRATLTYAGLTEGAEKADIPSDSGNEQPGNKFQPDLLDWFKPRPPAERPGMNQDTFTLDEGQVILQWPSRISPESYEDLKDWLDLMARKVKRAVRTDEPGDDTKGE